MEDVSDDFDPIVSPDISANQTDGNSTLNATLLGAPASVDWRNSGVVSSVKDQGKCASCYAFVAAGAIESIYKIKKGTLHDLSPQQIVDCSTVNRNAGCKGGFMTYAYSYLQSRKLAKNSDYPYTGVVGTCKYNANVGITNVPSYVTLPKNDVNAIMNAVAQQPVSVGMSAFCGTFMLYKSGILTRSCGPVLNHAVLIVGYGSLNGQNFWIVKNSWGTKWGEQGYFRIARGTGAGVGGINSLASYPNI